MTRGIESLYMRHRGESVWIVGSDPSLSNYPDNFLDDKNAMTLHLAHLKFPNATYRYSSEYDRSEYLVSHGGDYKKQPLIAALPMYGRSKGETRALLDSFAQVYTHGFSPYPPYGVRDWVSKSFTAWKIRQTLKGAARVWGSHGTCLHTAFFAALHLGFSAINIIGAGHGLFATDTEHFAQVAATAKEIRPTEPTFYDKAFAFPTIEQTWYLVECAREAGLSVNWYKNYESGALTKIEVDSAWIAEQKRIVQHLREKPSFARAAGRLLVKAPRNFIASRL